MSWHASVVPSFLGFLMFRNIASFPIEVLKHIVILYKDNVDPTTVKTRCRCHVPYVFIAKLHFCHKTDRLFIGKKELFIGVF